MEPESMRHDVRTALDQLLGASPGLEDRVLATLPRSPARPGQRVPREHGGPGPNLRWPIAAVAVALVAIVVVGSIALRAAGSHVAPAAGGTPPGPFLTPSEFSGAGSGWVVSQRISLVAQDPNLLATVYRTDDAGASWHAQLRVSLSGAHIRASADGRRAVLWGIFERPVPMPTPSIPGGSRPGIAQAYAESLQAYRTVDGGAHWTAMTALPASIMATFSDPDHGLAAGSPGQSVFATADGGASWTRVGALPSPGGVTAQPSFGGQPSISELDASTAWYATGTSEAGHSGLYATHDGGRTWAEVALPAPPGLPPGWTLLVDPPPTVFPDGTGLLLASAGSYVPSRPSQGAATEPVQPVARELFVYQTRDGGRTWGAPRPLFPSGSSQAGLRTRAGTEFGTDQAFQFLDATHWWLAMDVVTGSSAKPGAAAPVVFATADGGATWTTRAATSTLGALRFVDAADGWAVEIVGGVPNRLVHTTDGGATWTAVPVPAP